MRPKGRAPVPASLPPDTFSGAPLVELGRIVGRHGIRGEVRLLPHNPDSQIFSTLTHVWLQPEGGVSQELRILFARPHKRVMLLRFEGVDTANQAETLVGCSVAAPRDMLPALSTDQAYYIELIGCPVVTDAGVPLGEVVRVFPTGSNDVCEVRGEGGEHLIPLIADVVVRMDVTSPQRLLIIRPIPGLLDDK